MSVSIDALLRDHQQAMAGFQTLVGEVPYERKGILYSEMFFLNRAVREVGAKRIIESGRARGQSTLILSLMFPDLEIISVEHDPDSPDVPVAAERLKNQSNVELLFGDATEMVPPMLREGDVVLIDGPKGHRGVRFALSCLETGRTSLVLLHDTNRKGAERDYLSKYMPEVVYSDDDTWVAATHSLDDAVADSIPEPNRYPVVSGESYGFCLGALPLKDRSYAGLRLAAVWDGFMFRMFRRQK